jgi:hypothetical protein
MDNKNRICAYCGQLTGESICHLCGGSGDQHREMEKERMLNPRFYNGYIVWPSWVDDFESISRYYFYLGDRLVQIIQFPRSFIYRVKGADDFNFDFMEFVWNLFLVAQGEKEVFEIEENMKENMAVVPATFEIRRIEPEKLTKEEAIQYWIERYQ